MKQSPNLTQLSFITHGFYNAADFHNSPHPILMNQVHSADVLFITDTPPNPPSVDALVTTTPGLNLTVKTADCAPVLLTDPFSQMIAAIHAGWRGAFQGVIENTIMTMLHHGARLSSIRAAIGPHIQLQSFQVSPETKALFPVTEDRFFTSKSGRILFDFDAYVRYRLIRAGISSVDSVGDDTVSDLQYFSYRRDPQNPGRQFNSIMIKESP